MQKQSTIETTIIQPQLLSQSLRSSRAHNQRYSISVSTYSMQTPITKRTQEIRKTPKVILETPDMKLSYNSQIQHRPYRNSRTSSVYSSMSVSKPSDIINADFQPQVIQHQEQQIPEEKQIKLNIDTSFMQSKFIQELQLILEKFEKFQSQNDKPQEDIPLNTYYQMEGDLNLIIQRIKNIIQRKQHRICELSQELLQQDERIKDLLEQINTIKKEYVPQSPTKTIPMSSSLTMSKEYNHSFVLGAQVELGDSIYNLSPDEQEETNEKNYKKIIKKLNDLIRNHEQKINQQDVKINNLRKRLRELKTTYNNQIDVNRNLKTNNQHLLELIEKQKQQIHQLTYQLEEERLKTIRCMNEK